MYSEPKLMPGAAYAFLVAESYGKPCKVFAISGQWFVAFGQ